ncbi:hypothetical protein ABH927_005402 [Planotetraspora sp. GP83]
MEWDRSISPEQLRFYLDGVRFHTINSNQVAAGTWGQRDQPRLLHPGVTLETTTDTGGGQDISSLANGEWALYQGVLKPVCPTGSPPEASPWDRTVYWAN